MKLIKFNEMLVRMGNFDSYLETIWISIIKQLLRGEYAKLWFKYQ